MNDDSLDSDIKELRRRVEEAPAKIASGHSDFFDHVLAGRQHLGKRRLSNDLDQKRQLARQAWHEFEIAISKCEAAASASTNDFDSADATKAATLLLDIKVDRAKAAFATEDAESTKLYAEELLSAARKLPQGDVGDAVFHGHRLLGLLAIDRGNRELAKHHCLASAQTNGSPQLSSFGPSMSLALRLLQAGEFATVQEFLKRCELFWEDPAGWLSGWQNQVAENRIPDFGPNLHY